MQSIQGEHTLIHSRTGALRQEAAIQYLRDNQDLCHHIARDHHIQCLPEEPLKAVPAIRQVPLIQDDHTAAALNRAAAIHQALQAAEEDILNQGPHLQDHPAHHPVDHPAAHLVDAGKKII